MADTHVNYGNQIQGLPYVSMGNDKETMGQRITRLMEARGHTQSSLARAMGLTRATIHQWVKDISPNIQPPNLLHLADELGTSPHYLVFGEYRSEGPPNSDTSATGRHRALRRPIRR
jgi:transcriptional regulator with XRE-family HTH domain